MARAAPYRWFQPPLLLGPEALLWGLVAVAIPTAIRAAVDGTVTGCEFTPYLPFVLASAIMMRWWAAGAVALLCVAIMGGLFGGPAHHDISCFVDSSAIFLASSAFMIGAAVLVRRTIKGLQTRGGDETLGGIVFSLEDGQVWASWYGQDSPVLLGSQRRVSEMMEDFLAQGRVANRLARSIP